MLWQTETLRNQKRIYVNIFASGISRFYSTANTLFTEVVYNIHETSTQKNDYLSGDALTLAIAMKLQRKNLENVIQQTNEAICYAKNDNNKTLGMAYGLRAECFYDLKQYSLCLADVEMAKKHKNRTFGKLKDDCLKMLDADGREKSPLSKGPRLSFPADENIPCFAQGLEVKQSKVYGKHIVTNRKLEIGQTVIIEEAFCIRSENSQNYAQCANCFERKANLMPCKNCAAVMFCSQKCYSVGHAKFHAIECGKRGVHTHWESARRIVMQTVIEAIKVFPNVSMLMDTIEKFLRQKPSASNEQNYYADPSIRAYMQFFALSRSFEHTPLMQDHQFIDYTKTIHSDIATNPLYRAQFETLEASRFLAHLILHHFFVIDTNGFDAISFLHGAFINELGTDNENLSGFTYAHGIYLNSSRLNHSCQPNIARIFMGNKLVGKVIRPIKRGEQLFVSYINPINLLKPKSYREERLATIYYFECKCKSCTSNSPPFKSSGKVNLDSLICQLLHMFEQSPGKDPSKNTLIVDRAEMLRFENSAVQFLQSNDSLHPTGETLLVQFLLMQIWNNLGR